jgi:hypothetical protein
MTSAQKTLVAFAIILLGWIGIYEAWRASDTHSRAPGRLLGGEDVVLEKASYGTTQTPPKAPLEALLRHLPARWLGKINWTMNSGRTNVSARPVFTFWLKFSSPAAASQQIGYGIADENGFETGMVFDGLYGSYQPSGFARNKIGLARSTSLFPRRSSKFFLRLYQQDAEGRRLRVAEFPIKNSLLHNPPSWPPQVLPIEWRTNGLVFSLVKAEVGIAPLARS